MPCYKPMEGFRSRDVTKNGKHKITFSRKNALADGISPMLLPCGQCVGCRLERSRQWAVRCMHEASLYDNNCFITLTFSDQYLPSDMSLDVREFQLFMKRLRKRFGEGIRFYHCGEYGEVYGRPHYHAILFNFDFEDKYVWSVNNGHRLYRSPSLEEVWPYGHSSIGTVTFESAAYVARYVMKKVTGDDAEEHYKWTDPNTGEVFDRKPEYTTMSRRPGIAKKWYDQFKDDVYPSDFVVVNGKKVKPPKYYDYLYEHEYPSDLEKIKKGRKANAKKFADDNTRERLVVREKCQLAKLANLPRNLDKDY
jgi:hypothetical protein